MEVLDSDPRTQLRSFSRQSRLNNFERVPGQLGIVSLTKGLKISKPVVSM